MIKGGGCGGYTYELSYEYENNLADVIYQNILVLDTATDQYLNQATLGWEIDGVQAEFVILNNTQESGRCGCGESFYMDKK